MTDERNQPTTGAEIFIHVSGLRCDHVFTAWRDFDSGGEAVCSKCGMGAMEHTLVIDPS